MNFRNRFCAWLMLWTRLMLWTSLGVLALERVSQAQPSYGGSRPVTNATELLPFNFEAATLVQAYAGNLIANGGTNINANGVAARLTGCLSHLYNTLGATSFVDAVLLPTGWNLPGTNPISLLGYRGYGTNVTQTTNGYYFPSPSSLEFWGLTNVGPYIGVAITYASTTNFQATGYRYLWNYSHANNYNAGSRLQLGFNSATLYGWTRDSGYAQSLPMVSRGYSGATGIGQGAYMLDEQTRNLFVQSDGTNILAYVDGLSCLVDTAGNQNCQANCTRISAGYRDDNNHWFIGTIKWWFVFNRPMTSNDNVRIDEAMRMLEPVTDIVVIGDSLSEFSSISPNWPSREWSAEIWHAAGWPADWRIHNHAYSGWTAATQMGAITNTLWHRRPWTPNRKGHAMICLGVNDIGNGGTVAATVTAVSNIYLYARSLGYVTHCITGPPLGTSATNYSAGKAANLLSYNVALRNMFTNQPYLVNYLWDMQTNITNPNDTLQLYDGLHTTLAERRRIGQIIGTNRVLWDR